jgi:hypothetical protein
MTSLYAVFRGRRQVTGNHSTMKETIKEAMFVGAAYREDRRNRLRDGYTVKRVPSPLKKVENSSLQSETDVPI